MRMRIGVVGRIERLYTWNLAFSNTVARRAALSDCAKPPVK